MTYELKGLPKGYPIGWVDKPYLYAEGDEFRHCSVQNCPEQPRFEIYHGPWVSDIRVPQGFTRGWWYVCPGHKDWLVANSEVGREG